MVDINSAAVDQTPMYTVTKEGKLVKKDSNQEIEKQRRFFLDMIFAQLKHQTPDDTVKSSEMTQVFSSLATVERLMNLEQNFISKMDKLIELYGSDTSKMLYHSNLINKDIVYGSKSDRLVNISKSVNSLPISYSINSKSGIDTTANLEISFYSENNVHEPEKSIRFSNVPVGKTQRHALPTNELQGGKYIMKLKATSISGSNLDVETYSLSSVAQVNNDGTITTNSGHQISINDIKAIINNSDKSNDLHSQNASEAKENIQNLLNQQDDSVKNVVNEKVDNSKNIQAHNAYSKYSPINYILDQGFTQIKG